MLLLNILIQDMKHKIKCLIYTYQPFNLFLMQRHRLVNDALKEELESGVHALSIVVSLCSFNKN